MEDWLNLNELLTAATALIQDIKKGKKEAGNFFQVVSNCVAATTLRFALFVLSRFVHHGHDTATRLGYVPS